MNKLKQQINLFFLALGFFTRLPIPASTQYSAKALNQSNRYFSLIGLLLAVILFLCFYLFQLLLPDYVAVILMMIASLLLTGAFHEDGLADMADGIGGAFEPEKRLKIMKDSRIGTYGMVTLLSALALKFALLLALSREFSLLIFMLAVLLASALSRAVAASLIFNTPYVSDSDTSKAKPVAAQQSRHELALLLLFGGLPLVFLPLLLSTVLIGALVLFRFAFRRWLIARIGGITGDCLGAGQQLAELLIYLLLLLGAGLLTL